MNEIIKTAVCVLLAIVVGVVAVSALPRSASQDLSKIRNKELFENFEIEDIQRIRVVKFDGIAADPFEIKRTSTGWVLPAEHDHPADRQQQVNAALRFLPNLVVTNVASDREADKEKFGVIEPSDAAENIGQKKVGTLIEAIGEGDEVLASAVVGARVAGDESKSFVLVPGRPNIYVVELDPDTLTTNFRDWIDQDLMRIDPYRIARMSVQRVESATPVALPSGQIDPGIVYDYKIDASFINGSWRLDNLWQFDEKREPEKVKLDGEKIDSDAFATIVEKLAVLKVADVRPKPEPVKGDVQADKDYVADSRNLRSLENHGFFVMPGGADGFKIVPKGGEIVVSMKDGVEYRIRFGDFAKATIDDEGQANRYAMISAVVNEDTFPKPQRGEKPTRKTSDSDDEKPPVPEDTDADEENADQASDKEDEKAEREYLRAVQDRKEQIERAYEVAERLNNRYGQWYYVITQDSFESLTPSEATIITK